MPLGVEPSQQISIPALREEGDGPMAANTDFLLYFNPRPPRGGRPERHHTLAAVRGISIHALREEGDFWRFPWTGCWAKFQSTPSARRATPFFDYIIPLFSDFNPRPPRGGRQ